MKRILKWVAGIVAACLLIALGVGGWMAVTYMTAPINTTGKVEFDRPLDIPPLADSRVEDGVRIFDLTMP